MSDNERLNSVVIIPLDQGYLVRAKFSQSGDIFKSLYDFKEKRSYAFEKYDNIDKFIRQRLSIEKEIENG